MAEKQKAPAPETRPRWRVRYNLWVQNPNPKDATGRLSDVMDLHAVDAADACKLCTEAVYAKYSKAEATPQKPNSISAELL